ncbi:hypothetical protein BJF78_25810 [Pseudonocardia sp. CNS-139]|nr:hypothetical protein BJF78_25810 [Pseudonocardia sp. CNS-139]
MPADRVRDVRRLERGDLLGRELHVDGRDGVLDVPRLVAPTIGAVTASLCSIHASATCACGRPRAFATSATALTTALSASS